MLFCHDGGDNSQEDEDYNDDGDYSMMTATTAPTPTAFASELLPSLLPQWQ